MTCTLCESPVPDAEAVWGVDFPDCGPVHTECADLDYRLSASDPVILRRIAERRIGEEGWLPYLADCLTVRREES